MGDILLLGGTRSHRHVHMLDNRAKTFAASPTKSAMRSRIIWINAGCDWTASESVHAPCVNHVISIWRMPELELCSYKSTSLQISRVYCKGGYVPHISLITFGKWFFQHLHSRQRSTPKYLY